MLEVAKIWYNTITIKISVVEFKFNSQIVDFYQFFFIGYNTGTRCLQSKKKMISEISQPALTLTALAVYLTMFY